MQALKRNYFEFFSLPAGFALDLTSLDEAYRLMQRSIHPDRFASAGPVEKRYAMQLATMANEAHRTLRDPLGRARYLCELNGVDVGAEDNTAMPPDFMMQQMVWREGLEEAVTARDALAVQALNDELASARSQLQAGLTTALDQDQDYEAAAALVRRWMFLERFEQELDTATRSLRLGK